MDPELSDATDVSPAGQVGTWTSDRLWPLSRASKPVR
jgi:hypothetical protein